MIFLLIKSSFKSLSKNRLTAFLTMLGIIIGITAVISIIAIGEGTKKEVQNITSEISSNQLNITGQPDYDVSNSNNTEYNKITEIEQAPYTNPLTRETVTFLKNKNIKGVTNIFDTPTTIQTELIYNNKIYSTKLLASDQNHKESLKINILYGNFIDIKDISNREKIAVIEQKMAKNMFGEESKAIGKYIRLGEQVFQIKGVIRDKINKNNNLMGVKLEDVDSYSIYIPYTTAGLFFDIQDTLENIVVQLELNQNPNIIKNEISTLLREKFELKKNRPNTFSITSSSEMVDQFNKITDIVTLTLASIAGISLLVGGIGIMNIMIISITERTREIGLRKALGAKNSDILLQFLFESIAITLTGGFIGIILGLVISFIIRYLGLPSELSWNSIILSTSILIVIGIVFGIYPAQRASKLNPIESLRFE
jgi:putative ABC transport system permease protein